MPTAAEAWSRKPSQRLDPTLSAGSNICGQYEALGVYHMASDAPRSISLFAIWRFLFHPRLPFVKMMQMLTIVNGMIIMMIITLMITESMIAMCSFRCVAIAIYRKS